MAEPEKSRASQDLPVRQVLFEDALDFDIVALAAGTLAQKLEDPSVAFALGGGFQGGFRVLIDKDNEIANLVMPHHPSPPDLADISAGDFDLVINDFLFQVVWASKVDRVLSAVMSFDPGWPGGYAARPMRIETNKDDGLVAPAVIYITARAMTAT